MVSAIAGLQPVSEREGKLRALLGLSRLIDGINDRIGKVIYWAVLVAVVVSTVNAVIRYLLNNSSNAWLEVQWYLFAGVFLLCSGYTLLRNEHIRIDILSSRLSRRAQTWIDILGGFLFLLPMSIIILRLSWPIVVESYVRHEASSDAGGLIRWPVKALIPVGFFLLTAQGVSEIIKRFAFLMGLIPDPAEKQHSSHNEPPEGERV